MKNSNSPHRSVLLEEVLASFEGVCLDVFLDGTLGAGGHAEAILAAHPEIERYIGIDQDQQALSLASQRLEKWKDKLQLSHANFSKFDEVLNALSIFALNGALVDLGVSSMQLDQSERGFSFSKAGPLDMRMNFESALTAEEIVNEWSEAEIGRIIREYGEEKKWRLAARKIVEKRVEGRIVTTTQLADLLKPLFPWNPRKGINPLTLIFQALRIAVNRELAVLDDFMPKMIDRLIPGGRLAVISFHSLEDRIVKEHMRLAASDKWDTSGLGGGLFRDKKPTGTLVFKKPLKPTEEEVQQNPRSRSAKLRVIEKMG